MHRGRVTLLIGVVSTVACVAAMACTTVSTDPDTVVAVRFDGSAYPSIVVGDSLRDSLGALQPIRATGLNYNGDAVEGAGFVFSSPDTNLRVFDFGGDGMAFARSRKTDGSPARIFATVGSLQSQPDSLLIVVRADSIKSVKDADTVNVSPSSGEASNASTPVQFTVFGDTLALAPKVTVPGWLVSFQLRYHGALLPTTDTTQAYTFVVVGSGTDARRKPTFIDSTDASGKVERAVFVRAPRQPEDTIFLIATIRQRKTGTTPISNEIRLLLRPGTTTTTRVSLP